MASGKDPKHIKYAVKCNAAETVAMLSTGVEGTIPSILSLYLAFRQPKCLTEETHKH